MLTVNREAVHQFQQRFQQLAHTLAKLEDRREFCVRKFLGYLEQDAHSTTRDWEAINLIEKASRERTFLFLLLLCFSHFRIRSV